MPDLGREYSMHTVLRTTAGRVSLALALAAGTAGAFSAPAWAAAHASPRHSAPAHDAQAHTGSGVEIGHAVAYVREPDGTIRRVR
jgi:hypothetical protein